MSKGTYRIWECYATHALPQQWPALIRFLGSFPFPIGRDLPWRLWATRLSRGLTHRELARILGVDPATLSSWERGILRPKGRKGETVRVWAEETLHFFSLSP